MCRYGCMQCGKPNCIKISQERQDTQIHSSQIIKEQILTHFMKACHQNYLSDLHGCAINNTDCSLSSMVKMKGACVWCAFSIH